jgi:hypothetical protein
MTHSVHVTSVLQAVRIFAGARQNRRGDVYPTGTGRLCNWKSDPNQPPADEFASFGAYQRTLSLECDQGEPGIVQWTPDKNTPDTVYYQVRQFAWKGVLLIWLVEQAKLHFERNGNAEQLSRNKVV